MDAQQDILKQLDTDAATVVKGDLSMLDLTPSGVVDLQPKKQTKAAAAAADEAATSAAQDEPSVKKRRRPAQPKRRKSAEGDDIIDDEDQAAQNTECQEKQAPKKRAKRDSATPAARKQPGYAMIKTEEERLTYALECLTKKRERREGAGGVGHTSISTCGVLANDLIEFYDEVLATFKRKFGRYIIQD
jgi:hypothetical protein